MATTTIKCQCGKPVILEYDLMGASSGTLNGTLRKHVCVQAPRMFGSLYEIIFLGFLTFLCTQSIFHSLSLSEIKEQTRPTTAEAP